MRKIIDDNTTNEDITAIVKMWIIGNLNIADRYNYDYQVGVANGMQRILQALYGYDIKSDKDIINAYSQLAKRTGFKKYVFKQRKVKR